MSFSFLNSAALWALPLSLLPVVIHLLFRKPPAIVEFGDLRFLKKVFERYRPQKRVHEWLILALRIFAILSLFLFFSRPVLHWGGKAGGEDSVAMVLLLDSSYSMQYQESGLSQWGRAARLCNIALHSLRESDRSSIVVFSDKIDYSSGYLTNQHSELALGLNAFKVSYRTTNILPALQVAYRLLSNSGASNKAILIVSDMAKHGWTAGSVNGTEQNGPGWKARMNYYDPEVRILYTQLPVMEKNVAVENVRLFPDLYTGLLKVQVDLKNFGSEPVTALPLFLEFDDNRTVNASQSLVRRQSETLVRLDGMEKRTVVLNASMPEERFLSGRAGIRPDGLNADNAFFFAQSAPQRIKVLCIEEPSGIAALSGESYYLRQALVSPPSPYEVTTVAPAEAKKLSLEFYHTVIWVNPAEVDPEFFSLLKNYIHKGGSLFVSMGGRSSAVPLDPLTEILPCTFAGVRETAALSVEPAGNPDDKELSEFKSEYDWQKVRVEKMVQPVIKESGEPSILLNDGTPLLIFSKDRKCAVWLSTIDRSWNNLASKPVFVPLTRFIVGKLSARNTEARMLNLTVGKPFEKEWLPTMSQDSVRIVSPSGGDVAARFYQKSLLSSPLEEPGLYSLAQKGGTKNVLEKFAVNVGASEFEGSGDRLSESELRGFLPESQWVSLRAGEEFKTELAAALRGKELSRFFLAMCAFFLLGEILLVGKKNG